MITLLAVLTLVAQVAAVVLTLDLLIARMRGRPARIAALVEADALRLAALAAVVAMAGSLYFSQVRDFLPCELCWYQRICMYPLALVLSIAAWRRDSSVARYAAPLAVVGAVISAYHVQLERFPDQAQVTCSASVPCTIVWFTECGYITIPVMALSAFVLITILLLIGARHGQGITQQGQ